MKGHKMKRNGLALLIVLALLVGSGCSSVITTHPLSPNPEPIDKEKFEGVWLLDDGTAHVKFSSNGIAQVAGLEWKKDKFRVNRCEAIVTQGKKHNFLSVRYLEGDGEWEGYYFLPYKFTDHGDLILWPPVPDVFEEMVESGKLQGMVEKSEYSISITITNAPGALLNIINDPDNLELFNYREPVVLRRIAADD